jgi:hypothetical protein
MTPPLLQVARGVEVAVQAQAALLAGEGPTRRLSSGFTVPQVEQVLEEGNQRWAVWSRPPAQRVL